MATTDTMGRALRDLRISVTDRCNFRCVYCMPKEVFGSAYRFLERRELLTFEEITRVAGTFVALGVEKLRITGGEPLVRRDLERLIEQLSPLGADLTLTTNGSLLPAKAEALAKAGLRRITVSLDSLDDATFQALNDVDFPAGRVLEGIDAAAAAGLPVKVNCVVKRGVNDRELTALAAHFRGTGHTLRFIEYMDVGHSNGWRLDDVVPAAEIVATLDAAFGSSRSRPPIRARSPGATATSTGRVRSASSRPSRSPSAAPVRGPASPPRESSTPACSPSAATICGRWSAAGHPTKSSPVRCKPCGEAVPTAIRSSDRPPRSASRRSK